MAMLGVPLVFPPPRVVGIRLTGALPRGATATDLVLHMAEFLRGIGVVGAFVEFHGDGVAGVSLADRATIANMSPEYGATCTYFPVDQMTIDYLRMTGRDEAHLRLVEAVARVRRASGRIRTIPLRLAFDEEHVFDLGRVGPSMAGPTRPEDRLPLAAVPRSFADRLAQLHGSDAAPGDGRQAGSRRGGDRRHHQLHQHIEPGDHDGGRSPRPQRSARRAPAESPGSRPRSRRAPVPSLTISPLPALPEPLDALGFNLVGYGCTTCNGNSGTARPRRDAGGRRRTASAPSRSCRATATSRAASIR